MVSGRSDAQRRTPAAAVQRRSKRHNTAKKSRGRRSRSERRARTAARMREQGGPAGGDDETSTNTAMVRPRPLPRGEREAACRRGRKTTPCGGSRHDKMVAPRGGWADDQSHLLAYLEQCLRPTPSAAISSHRQPSGPQRCCCGEGHQNCACAAALSAEIPPDLNPIELASAN